MFERVDGHTSYFVAIMPGGHAFVNHRLGKCLDQQAVVACAAECLTVTKQ